MRGIVMSFFKKEDPLIGGSSCDGATRISQKARRSKEEKVKVEKVFAENVRYHVSSL
jgi:hypothetical protein